MSKVLMKPATMVYPAPTAMVSCGTAESGYNIITIAWTGIMNSEPPMTYISVRKSRYSHAIIEREREFAINLPNEKLTFAMDYCGMKSGREIDKFKEMKLTAGSSEQLSCPIIMEAPINVECKVKDVLTYPSHDMFVAEIVKIHVDESILGQNGKIDITKAGLICLSGDDYYGLSQKPVGAFGFSLKG